MKTHKQYATPKQQANNLVRIHFNLTGDDTTIDQSIEHAIETAKFLAMYTRSDEYDRPKMPFDKEYWLEVIKELKK